MRSDVQKFQDDLLASVKQMKRGHVARVTKVKLPAAAEARASIGLSQQEFARLLGVSPCVRIVVATTEAIKDESEIQAVSFKR